MSKELELYIHIPFCMKKCDYCDFLSFAADDRTQEEYVDALLQEIKYYGSHLPKVSDYVVTSVFFGGGTPSWLNADLIERIMLSLRANFTILPDAEISIECNPGTATINKLDLYHKLGINRLSIGCQSTDNDELKLLGRVHNFDHFMKIYEMARQVGFSNINIDLMSCLPYQDAEKFRNTLNTVCRLKPEHLSVYTLIIEEGTPFFDRYGNDEERQRAGQPTVALPTEDEAYKIYKMTQSFLRENGYEQYEISNYAKPGYECKHNVGYWRRANYLGLGLGASSLVENVRYTNISDIYKYLKSAYMVEGIETEGAPLATNLHTTVDVLSERDQIEEFMFLGLRMVDGVSKRDFERNFGKSIDAVYHDVMEDLVKKGLLLVTDERVMLTDRGIDLANFAMAQFLED